ncbi:MAG: DUF881 domain-containing protein [Clostridium sp.]|nr:DUF881 domain-containing protein [Clostridium sp.]MDY3827872.1 DUF881 domain-containing protein [Clostridium sp.]
MKKQSSQIYVALVCAILGFLLAYQFKQLSISETNNNVDYSGIEISSEVEALRKEKEELSRSNVELNKRLKELEISAVEEGKVELETKKQLDIARMQLGILPVTGPGIKINISLKSTMFDNSLESTGILNDTDIVDLINTLWFSKAEAISINGYRITPQTGVKVSGNSIWIGAVGKVNPIEPIEILAIGDTTKMKVGLEFQSFNYGNYSYYNVNVSEEDDIVIEKTTQALRNDYLTNVEEKEQVEENK